MRPALSRVPGVGNVEVLSSDTREIEVIARSRASSRPRELTVDDVAEALKAPNQLAAGRPLSGERPAAPGARLGPLDSSADIATRQSWSRAARRSACRTSRRCAGRARPHLLVTGNGGDATSISVSQQIGANILDVEPGVETALAELAKTLPAGLHDEDLRPRRVRRRRDRERPRRDPHRRRAWRSSSCSLFLRDWRLTLVAALTLPLTVMATFFFMRLFGEIDQPDVDGRPRGRDRPGHRRRGGRRREHPPAARAKAAARARSSRDAASSMAPVVGSTLTTVVVFAPLGLLSGVVGQFFSALSMTLSVAVLHLARPVADADPAARAVGAYRRPPARHARRARRRRRARATRRRSRRCCAAGRRWRGVALLLAALARLLCSASAPASCPQADEGGFVIDYLTPAGQRARGDRRAGAQGRDGPAAHAGGRRYSRRTGSELGLFATQQNTGDILVRLKPRGERSRSAEEIIATCAPS